MIHGVRMLLANQRQRRGFMGATLALAVGALSVPANARQPLTVAYIDIDQPGARDAYGRFLRAVEVRRLAERYGIEVTFVAVDQTDAAALAALPERLRRMRPWLAIATSLPTTQVVYDLGLRALFYSPADSITLKWVRKMEQPDGKMTGYSGRLASLEKMIEAMMDALPRVRRIGILTDRLYAQHAGMERVLAFARNSGLEATFEMVDTLDEFDAFALDRLSSCEALIVPYTAVPFRHGERVVKAIMAAKVPAIYGSQRLVRMGGLLAMEADISDVAEVFARQLEEVAKGVMPGKIPVERPSRFPMTVNLEAARALGVELSAGILKRADVVLN